jgi:hypothetical protein
VGTYQTDAAKELDILLAGSAFASDDQVIVALAGESKSVVVVFRNVDIPLFAVEEVDKELIDVRAGIDDERLAVLDGKRVG